MYLKNNLTKIQSSLSKEKVIAMIAPSFASEYEYPKIISQLRALGFDKIVELTFGAKIINKEYHNQLKSTKKLLISSVCPGTVETIVSQYPQYSKYLIKVDSPMIAMGKICKKYYPKHKTCFISPCHFKKNEAEKSKYINYTIDYQQLNTILPKKFKRSKQSFDLFYNDYTKVYPITGGLSKTAHLKGIIHKDETIILDGIQSLKNYFKSTNKKLKFIDTTFCKGGCIGGPCLTEKNLPKKKKKLMHYLEIAKREKIPIKHKGLMFEAKGLKFTY